MTQVEKDLLLKDLCARLPYGLICSIYRIDDWNVGWRYEKLTGYFYDGTAYEFYFGESPISIDNDISKIKPYLRPMSSIIEEEKVQLSQYACIGEYLNGEFIDEVQRKDCAAYIDWLNKNHFDFRGLIEKGLALEAPKGMYNLKVI